MTSQTSNNTYAIMRKGSDQCLPFATIQDLHALIGWKSLDTLVELHYQGYYITVFSNHDLKPIAIYSMDSYNLLRERELKK